MGMGGVVFSALALFGMYSLLMAVHWLYAGLKIAGGMYLVYVGVMMWRGARKPLVLDGVHNGMSNGAQHAFRTALRTGLVTQLSNPKAAIFYGSIFAALLPQHPPVWCYLALPPAVFLIEGGWYAAVAVFFSSRHARDLYSKAKTAIDRVGATIVTALGLRLILTAHRSGI
ncbi:hypothetical protein PBS_54250 [Paraburkholderia sp. 2C]